MLSDSKESTRGAFLTNNRLLQIKRAVNIEVLKARELEIWRSPLRLAWCYFHFLGFKRYETD
jgi:hypothetical protein